MRCTGILLCDKLVLIREVRKSLSAESGFSLSSCCPCLLWNVIWHFRAILAMSAMALSLMYKPHQIKYSSYSQTFSSATPFKQAFFLLEWLYYMKAYVQGFSLCNSRLILSVTPQHSISYYLTAVEKGTCGLLPTSPSYGGLLGPCGWSETFSICYLQWQNGII